MGDEGFDSEDFVVNSGQEDLSKGKLDMKFTAQLSEEFLPRMENIKQNYIAEVKGKLNGLKTTRDKLKNDVIDIMEGIIDQKMGEVDLVDQQASLGGTPSHK